MFDGMHWYAVKDGDLTVRYLANRHYSARAYRDGRRVALTVGPGEKMVLKTADGLAAFVWRKFIDDAGQAGVNCALFRNEGATRSSELILEAEQLAWSRWPGERLYTYVNPRRVKSRNPGYCFIMAGWRKCGTTKGGLLIFEKTPERGRAWAAVGGEIQPA